MGTKAYDNALDLITFTRASSATYLDSDGLLKTATTNIPRIEYAADGTLKGLLVEEARTNLLTWSEAFDNAAWTKTSGATIGVNVEVAPDGTTSADKVISANATAFLGVSQLETVASAGLHTLSFYVKQAGARYVQLLWNSTLSTQYANFDLQEGVVTAGTYDSATVEAFGDGWYRCSVTGTLAAATGGNFIFALDGPTAVRSSTFTGDGTSGFYLWGAQFEAGAFPTSYIPTAGATATRAADIASIPVSAFGYNQKAGSVVVEFDSSGFDPQLSSAVTFSDGTTNNRWTVRAAYAQSWHTSGTSNGVLNYSDVGTTAAKVAYAISSKEQAASLNGETVLTDATTGMPSAITTVYIGNRFDGVTYDLNGHIKSIAYYPRRLSNAQLQELTS